VESSASWSWLRIERRVALIMLAASVGIGVWQGDAAWLSLRAQGRDIAWVRPLTWELTGALSACLWAWLPFLAAKNANEPLRRPLRFVGVHAVGYLLFAGLHTLVMLGSRAALYDLAGWEPYHYSGRPLLSLGMEWHKDAITYLALAVGFGLTRSWQESRRRAIREAQREAELKSAQLQVLTHQLDPHFLFNALNTVSSVMYTDLEKTDRLLADLGQVLRASLAHGATPTWPLRDERAHAERYLAVMLARFGDRLTVSWDVAPDALVVQVPRFSLQLLVENALKHNADLEQPLAVSIVARRVDGRVEIEVRDNGRGFGDAPAADGSGFGLASLRRALDLCHGPGASLGLSNAEGGGARVQISLPVEAAPA
jgi:signal transduction histidine kinase